MRWIVATITDGANILGFRVLDTGKAKVSNVSTTRILDVIQKADRSNFTVVDGKLHPVYHGLDRIPLVKKVDNEFRVIKNDVVIILGEVIQTYLAEPQKLVGYMVTDYQGEIQELSIEETLKYESVGFHNARVIQKRAKVLLDPAGLMGFKAKFPLFFKGTRVPQSIVDEANSLIKKIYPDLKLN